MIEKLEHSKLKTAEKIYLVWQASYIIEARLLKAKHFPPLKRSVEDFTKSKTDFYSYTLNGDFSGIVELNTSHSFIHIQSLVVHPRYFRNGIASQLIEHVLGKYQPRTFTVETGLENAPAIGLYNKHGFVEDSQFDTDHGIRKIKLILNR